MKFEYGNNPVVIEGNIESSNYGAKAENLPFLLNMLQTTLYSDKPLAICREYITNAWDAHVDAGKGDLPIHIAMPCTFSPTIKIRDFGKGLSKDEVLHHFTSYGDSGKRHTDDMVGGFGLGSKSAFCYVPSFTVVSYHNGVKMTFNAQIEEKNTTMNHLRDMDVPTNETGVEIQLSVKPSDVFSFKNTLVRLLTFHKPTPVFTNDTYVSNIINTPLKVVLEGSNWKILDPDALSENTVVLGNVPYTFDSFKFDYDFRDRLSQFGDLKFVITLQPNSLNVTLNREALEYTQKTLTNLRTELNIAMDEYEREFIAKFETFDSIWEAKKFLTSFRNHRISFKPVVDGFSIRKTTLDLNSLKFKDHHWLQSNERWTKIGYHEINCADSSYLFIARPDIAKSSIRLRTQMYMENNNLSKGYGDANSFEIFQFDSHVDADEFVNSSHVRGANVIELNTVIMPKITKSNVRTASIRSQGYDYSHSTFNPTTVDLNNGEGVYVPIAYNHCSDRMPLFWQTNENLSLIKDAINRAFNTSVKIVGIKNQEVSRLGKGWIRLDNYVQSLIHDMDYSERKRFTRHFLYEVYNWSDEMFNLVEYMPFENPHYRTAQWLNEFKDRNSFMSFKHTVTVLKDAGFTLPTWESEAVIKSMEEFIADYPIVNLVKSNTISHDYEWEVVRHYLKIDQ